jgi:hypothetical protein
MARIVEAVGLYKTGKVTCEPATKRPGPETPERPWSHLYNLLVRCSDGRGGADCQRMIEFG